MTQLTVPPPYSLVLLIQVKTPTSIFGEPSFLHLDSFLRLQKDHAGLLGSCQTTAWLHTWEANEWREKESLILPPAWHKCEESWDRGREQPLELQQQMWHGQSPSWSSCGGGSMGPIIKVWSCYSSGWGAGLAVADSWRWGIRLGAPRCTAAPLWVDLVGFSSWSPCSKGSDQLSQKVR